MPTAAYPGGMGADEAELYPLDPEGGQGIKACGFRYGLRIH